MSLHKHSSDLLYTGEHTSDQLELDRIIQGTTAAELHWAYVDEKRFMPGKWYADKQMQEQERPKPMVVLNNWIVGNDAKVERATLWGHWFLVGRQSCREEDWYWNGST